MNTRRDHDHSNIHLQRDLKRTLTCGAVISQPRYVLNFNDPRTGKRRQLFFRSQREAIARRDSILAAIATNSYSESRNQMTVGGAVEHWLENRRSEVKASTWKTYRQISTNCIIGPLLVGTPGERKSYREVGIETRRHLLRRGAGGHQSMRPDHRRYPTLASNASG